MADEIVLHPNSPASVVFECPACGRECLLTPVFGDKGASLGVRLGHGVQHSVPVCRTYRTMRRIDFLVLATTEVPVIRDDVHVSVKLPEAPPLIFVDGGKASQAAERAAEEQARDVAVFRGEASDLARLRDWIVQDEAAERERRALGWWSIVNAACAVLNAFVFAWRPSWWWGCAAVAALNVAVLIGVRWRRKRLATRPRI